MSGVMVELGVYAVARVYDTVFAPVIAHAVVEHAFVALGVLSAVVGSVMCLVQRHLKRLLAYSTIAHVGLFLIAVGVGDADSIAGTVLYVVGHAGVKGALFLLAGVLLNRFRSVDEGELSGRGGGPRDPLCWLYLIAGLAPAGLPPFGPGLGKAVAEDAAKVAGLPWTPAVFVLVSAATSGAVLRAGARTFLGPGWLLEPPAGDQTAGDNEEPETEQDEPRTSPSMVAAAAALLSWVWRWGWCPPWRGWRARARSCSPTVRDTRRRRWRGRRGAARTRPPRWPGTCPASCSGWCPRCSPSRSPAPAFAACGCIRWSRC